MTRRRGLSGGSAHSAPLGYVVEGLLRELSRLMRRIPLCGVEDAGSLWIALRPARSFLGLCWPRRVALSTVTWLGVGWAMHRCFRYLAYEERPATACKRPLRGHRMGGGEELRIGSICEELRIVDLEMELCR